MDMPMVRNAPVISSYTRNFKNFFANQAQHEHFKHYLSGLIVLENKSMANMARCILKSADKTNLSRFFQAPWNQGKINEHRIGLLLERTASYRVKESESCFIIDDTFCEHTGEVFEHIARHYEHSRHCSVLAHNPVTSHFVSGPVRFPLDLENYRRYEEFTQWESFVKKHLPEREIPRQARARRKFSKEVEPILLQDHEFRQLHESFQTKIDLARGLFQRALERQIPFSVVLMDAWYLVPDFIQEIELANKAWISLLKRNRNLLTQS